MEKNVKTLKSLRERFYRQNFFNSSGVKKVAKLTMMCVISVSILFSTACGLKSKVNDIIDNNATNNENNQQTGGDNVVAETPEGGKVDISNFSQVLQTVLTDDYYRNLVEIQKDSSRLSCSTANKYQAIPYGFLEDEGYNITAIKNNEIACETDVFVINNELYIACRVENKTSTPYYTHYVIKYSLSEQELQDLNLVFREFPDGANTYRTISYQAPFFIQELSNQKDAQVLSKNHITKDGEKSAEENIQSKRPYNSGVQLDLSNFSNYISATYVKEDTETFSSTFLFFNAPVQATASIKKNYVAIVTVTAGSSMLQKINGNDVYKGFVSNYVLSNNVTEFESSQTLATFYNSYESGFIDMLSYSSFYDFN